MTTVTLSGPQPSLAIPRVVEIRPGKKASRILGGASGKNRPLGLFQCPLLQARVYAKAELIGYERP